MKTYLFGVTVLLLIPMCARTQDNNQIFSYDYDPSSVDITQFASNTMLKEHFLGNQMAKKFGLLKSSYTWVEPASATSPTKTTIVEKPAIYYSVNKVNSYLKKTYKKGKISLENADRIMNAVLDKALIIRYQQTEQLESAIRKIKDPLDLIEFFDKSILFN